MSTNNQEEWKKEFDRRFCFDGNLKLTAQNIESGSHWYLTAGELKYFIASLLTSETAKAAERERQRIYNSVDSYMENHIEDVKFQRHWFKGHLHNLLQPHAEGEN